MARLKLQDKLSIVFSLLALLISIGTFTFDKIQAGREKREKEVQAEKEKTENQRKNLYLAYILGKDFTIAHIYWFQTTKSSPNNPLTEKQIQRGKQEAYYQLNIAQGIADQLDLRMSELKLLLENENPKDSTSSASRPIEALEGRIRVIHGDETAAAYNIGHLLYWYSIEAGISQTVSPEKEQWIVNNYPAVANEVNSNFSKLGITQLLPAQVKTTKEIIEVCGNRKELIEKLWSH